MANLKRNMIKMVKNPEEAMKGAEIQYETYWTSPFLPTEVTYEAQDIGEKLDSEEMTEREGLSMLEHFVAEKLYGGQFTVDDIHKKIHGPDLLNEMRNQLVFITQGQQTDETKNFLAKKN